jgi:hypothetical protein
MAMPHLMFYAPGAVAQLRATGARLHSRKLRAFNETPFR